MLFSKALLRSDSSLRDSSLLSSLNKGYLQPHNSNIPRPRESQPHKFWCIHGGLIVLLCI